MHYCEAECIKIDAKNKKVYCRSNLNGKEEFAVDYDYLVIAIGARVNTFNIPGVEENTFFLKVISRILFLCCEPATTMSLCAPQPHYY